VGKFLGQADTCSIHQNTPILSHRRWIYGRDKLDFSIRPTRSSLSGVLRHTAPNLLNQKRVDSSFGLGVAASRWPIRGDKAKWLILWPLGRAMPMLNGITGAGVIILAATLELDCDSMPAWTNVRRSLSIILLPPQATSKRRISLVSREKALNDWLSVKRWQVASDLRVKSAIEKQVSLRQHY